MIVRICGEASFSSTPSFTDLMSARIIARPTRPPTGERTGRKIATRAIFDAGLVTIRRSVVAERFNRLENNIVLIGPERAFTQPKCIGLFVPE